MEQRTGRIDRIDSLVQRKLDGRQTPPTGDELIQVFYPHLVDTVEVLQVKRVLMRLYNFLSLIHAPKAKKDSDQSRLYVPQEILEQCHNIPKIEGLLESAFPVLDDWLAGQFDASQVVKPDIKQLEDYLRTLWQKLKYKIQIDDRETPQDSQRRYVGIVGLQNKRVIGSTTEKIEREQRKQSFQLELRSQVVGGATLLRCVSPVGEIDLNDKNNLNALYSLQHKTGMPKICATYDPKRKKHIVTVAGDRLFNLNTTQWQEIEDLIVRTVEAADRIESSMLECDEDVRHLDIIREVARK
jgi:hypothetical protein